MGVKPRAVTAGRNPTVRDVAAHAGVSPMTVSRTLSGGHNVREEVQARVMESVEALGYTRNENARSLRPGQSTGLVGIAITNLGNPYYGSFALGVEDIAAQHGAQILLGNTAEDPVRERELVSEFLGRQVDGLIVVPTGVESDHLRPSHLGRVPLVLASREIPGLDVDVALLADEEGAYEATRTLLARGHRRIGFLGFHTSIFTTQRRFDGFSRALREAGVDELPDLIKGGHRSTDDARAAMTELLRLAEPPTAVFSTNNRTTIGALQAIGHWLPFGAISNAPMIVGFDDIELAELLPVPLITVSHDARELGRIAATLLFERMDPATSSRPSQRVEVPVTLKERSA